MAGPGARGRPRAGRRGGDRRPQAGDPVLRADRPAAVATAWAAASSFRGTDLRGGANGARLRLEPERSWGVNAGLVPVLETLERIQKESDARISLADLTVLGGCAAVEQAAREAGHEVTVPFTPGRTDATQEQTDIESSGVLEPVADGFPNWARAEDKVPAEVRLLDKANLLTLTAPEMAVLVGGRGR